ncbi:MATE family efflux transporter [Bacteroides sp.]|uniref:MATE family efflux transporter n=1 Tax=Bacteroides sp. TaxID=29523 RepID=UPI001B596D6A|nr:MATE family efflux transporter [Bacteroides sp.]MBP6065985.1 MATE family efflux transporter [Bacteroides sp.]MBP6068002.1 MATE family efflux transporter [Bacteroides sp.]MBP6937121.1 MATE family efflux transporter [Bacteroides sp.]MBP8622489.1 MATE family efflux transporter [Bacteroides sp.]MBP9586363.1 MATE family efflux transporter [Bacteroides sp.]
MTEPFFKTYKGHYRALIYLGLPIVIGQVGMIVLSFADTLMIGHHSTNELAAASFVNNVFNLAIIFSTGFSYGLTPIVGSLYGNHQFAPAGQALRCSLLANFLVSLLLTTLMGVLYLNIEHLGQPDELMMHIKPYYLVLLSSLVFVLLFNGFKQFTDGITDTRTSMWILLGGNVFNIIGNYILINGHLGFPELGLLGAGISTLFSRVLMVLVFVFVFLRGRRFLRYKVGFLRLGWSRSLLVRLNALGWPVALQMGMETASFSLSAVMVGWLGTIALASHQIMSTISQFTFMMFYGMGAAVAVRVSNFKGQNDVVNVRRAAYAGFHLITAMVVVLSSIVFLFRNHLGGWFTDSPEVSAMVVTLIIPMLIYQFGDGLQINFANALRGISDVKPMMLIAFISYFLISLPVSYFCGFVLGWGVVGVWMAFPFGLTSAGIMLWLRFRYKTK